MELIDILSKSENKSFHQYTEFPLNNSLNMKKKSNQKLIYRLNQQSNQKAYYNSKTYNCDLIGIVDIKGTRYYDFDDNIWTLTNKGIDVSTSKTIFD